MNLPRQPFVGLALIAVLGIIVADFFPIAASYWWLSANVFALLAIPLFVWPTLGSTYVFIGAGFFLLHNFRIGDTAGLQLAADLSDRPRVVNAVGFVTSEPKVAPNGFATFLFKLESIELEGKTASTNATLLVRWRGSPEFGDELKLFGMAEPIAPPRNPGEFDMRSYLARQDVRRTLFVRYPEDGLLVQIRAGNRSLRAAQKSRAWMQTAICRGLDASPEVQNFLSGIVLGLRHQTTEDIEEPFQQTGTLHLFAVAGLHVGIVARLLWILAMMARLSRKWATAFIIPLLLFYAAVTGLHVSSIRAAVMSSILLGGFFFERKVFSLNSLAAAAFFLLSWNTNEAFSTGFQLSFAVVGAIILLADPLSGWLRPIGAPDPFLPRRLVSGLRRMIGVGYESICRGGAGAAIHLHARRADWLFDCGSGRDYEIRLRSYLHLAGINRIDGLLLTHGDSLHIGATESLVRDLAPTVMIDNPAADRSTIHRRLREMFRSQGLNLVSLKTGEEFPLSPGVTGKILFPPANFTGSTADDQAFVVQLSVKTGKILFMSDSGYATERLLIGSGADVRSDVLIKGQHHSGNSGSDIFLDAVRPRLIVATSRDFPQQERISDEWAGRIRARGIKLFRQDETGAVELEFAERGWEARAYLTGEIFRSANR